MSGRGSRRWRAIVIQHLRNLFQAAETVAPTDPELARRYVQMARRIVKRTRVRLPHELRNGFCHRCDQYLRPGVNARVRTRTAGPYGSVVITCLSCGYRRKVFWTRRERVKPSALVKKATN